MSREKDYSKSVDKRRIKRLFSYGKLVGYSSYRISEKLKIPLYRVRRVLKELETEDVIFSYAMWYGKNMGYKRLYRRIDFIAEKL